MKGVFRMLFEHIMGYYLSMTFSYGLWSVDMPIAPRTVFEDWIKNFEPEPAREHWLVTAIMKWAYKDASKAKRLGYPRAHSTPDQFRDYEFNAAYLYFINLKISGVDLSVFDGKEVLDVGCGRGGKTIYIAQNTKLKSIHGFDVPAVFKPEDAERYAKAKGVSNCTFSLGYGEDMKFADNSFDLVVSDDVIEHVDDPERVFQEVYRVLRPAGLAIMKFPSYKMVTGHHYDGVLNLPGLQYLLPYSTWAAGLNYLLSRPEFAGQYDALPRAVSTKYHPNITPILNGIDFKGAKQAIAKTDFEVIQLSMFPYFINLARHSETLLRKSALFVYNKVLPVLGLQELVSTQIVFVGRKPN